jgi:hypothetical protein
LGVERTLFYFVCVGAVGGCLFRIGNESDSAVVLPVEAHQPCRVGLRFAVADGLLEDHRYCPAIAVDRRFGEIIPCVQVGFNRLGRDVVEGNLPEDRQELTDCRAVAGIGGFVLLRVNESICRNLFKENRTASPNLRHLDAHPGISLATLIESDRV